MRGVHGAVGGAGQTGCESRALVGEMSRICGGTSRGKVWGHVWCLLWKEGPRVQLKAARHQVSGRLRQTWEHRGSDRSVFISDMERNVIYNSTLSAEAMLSGLDHFFIWWSSSKLLI